MDFLNLNESVKTAVHIAQEIAREYGNSCYTPAHLLKALLHKKIGLHGFLENLDKDIAYLEEWAEVRLDDEPKNGSNTEITATAQVADVFEMADNVRIDWGLLEINPICVLTALSKPDIGFTADQLKSFPIREKEVYDVFLQNTQANAAIGHYPSEDGNFDAPAPITNLNKYCINKTDMVREDNAVATVCRDKENRIMMEILGRHQKPNVLIIGDSGVGKTALVDGLAFNIVNNKVPSYLEGSVIYELDTGALIAGATYKGEIEDRLKNIIKELNQTDRAILFIDEIQVLLDPKQGNTGAAGILKPELSKGNLTVIATTTVDEYRKLVEPDHAFNRRFEVLKIEEPDNKSAILMVNAVLSKYSDFHNIKITNEAINDCVVLAKRYDKDRRLPDAAIDLLDRTMSAVKMVNETAPALIQELIIDLEKLEDDVRSDDAKLNDIQTLHMVIQNKLSPVLMAVITNETDVNQIENYRDWYDYLSDSLALINEFVKNKIVEISSHEVAAVISNKTGIPIGKIKSSEKERLLHMESLLRRRVVGQDDALKSLTDAILESRSGMNKPGQPIGSFFLLGPTGTGKTELAKALAELLFNDEKAMIRFDMSEFKEEHSAALLYGAPPGYVGYEEGGMLVNKIRQQPYAVVLFDEIEKAHASVYDIFLQIMDEGKLHDRLGKEGDFSNAIILFTSNVGSQWLMEQKSAGNNPTTTQIMDVMADYFRPEFLARLSEIVPFSPISEEILLKIFDIQLQSVIDVLNKKDIELNISEEAKRSLAHKGFTPRYGARQISGVIRNHIRRPISKYLISNKLTNNDTVYVDVDEKSELVWSINTPVEVEDTTPAQTDIITSELTPTNS